MTTGSPSRPYLANATFEIEGEENEYRRRTHPAVSGALGRSQSTRIPADFGVVCLWGLLGLELTAPAIALGFGAEIAEALAMAG